MIPLASKYFRSSSIQHWPGISNNWHGQTQIGSFFPGGVFVKNIRFVLAILFLGFLAVSLTACERAELTNISVSNTTTSVTPSNLTIPLGVNQQFTATGRFSDGTTRDLTTQVTWTSSNPSVATINSTALATTVAPGITTISATASTNYNPTGNAIGTATLSVVPALSSIALTPSNPNTPLGVNQQFTATGTYSDGTTEDITAQVTWTSSNPTVATINSTGLATTVTVGPATITATQRSISGSGALTVNPATLASIALTPATPSIPVGVNQRFTATGTYSDGTTFDITTQVIWTSSLPSLASIDSGGLATSLATGLLTIFAASGSISGSTNLTVNLATLSSIAVTPAFPSIPVGFTQVFKATGTYSDGTIFDITTQVTWSSPNTTTVNINGVATTVSLVTVNVYGVATPISAGTADIIATRGIITGSTFLVVTSG